MREIAAFRRPWRDPVEVAAAGADAPWALAFLSDGSAVRGRWSYVMADPAKTLQLGPDDPRDPFQTLRALLGPPEPAPAEGPPFQGGIAGLLCYELGARLEGVGHRAHPDWPLAACALYDSVLAFDHHRREVLAIGRGTDAAGARRRAEAALQRLDQAPARPEPDLERPLTPAFETLTAGEAYEASVASVVERIAAGEIFQANAARVWGGRMARGARPFDLLERLWRTSSAPFAAYFRLPGRAVVSNSPERFVFVSNDGELTVETRPIKGTRPRGGDAAQDEALKRELVGCEKDRAENLMIVDLMRNDLSRVCPPGAVGVSELFAVETFANVHHLVSTVTGRLAPGLTAVDLLEAAFPPGSITGAPKIQAIKVIADYEGPRGPYCGSMFWAGFSGGCDSSVLIRTVGFVETPDGWRYEARAGAGLVADSDPVLERLETEAKIDALRRAFLGSTA
jgi:para-aminobenzoate synthetase component 1